MSSKRHNVGWIILRTSGAKTLKLAESLREEGFDVWTPSRVSSQRIPRGNGRRSVAIPIIPTFLFARVWHLVDLLELAAMPERPRRGPGGRKPAHPAFSVFRDGGSEMIPVVDDAQLDPLREAERRIASHRMRQYEPGEMVKVPDGIFGGLVGEVVRSSQYKTKVCFGGRMSVEVSTFILKPIGCIGSSQALKGSVADAA